MGADVMGESPAEDGVLSVFGDRQIGPKRRTDLVSASTIQDEAFLQEFEPSPPKHLSLEHF